MARGERGYCFLCNSGDCKCELLPRCRVCGTINWECKCGKGTMAVAIKKTLPSKTPAKTPGKIAVAVGDGLNAPTWMAGTGNRVSVAMGKTINIGNYETVRVDCSHSMEIGPGESYADATKKVAKSVADNLKTLIETVTEQFSS